MTLAEFLLARFAEDETWARAALNAEPALWGQVDARELPDLDVTLGTLQHIARHSPTRVLAECEAKQRIIQSVEIVTGGDLTYRQRLEHTDIEDHKYVITRDMLRWLALPYADHPDYDETWRP